VFAVDPHRPLLQRTGEIVGRIQQREQIASGLILAGRLTLERGNESLDRRIARARARAHAGKGAIHPGSAMRDGHQGIGYAQGKIVVDRQNFLRRNLFSSILYDKIRYSIAS
jgi:hypothetical protein